MGVEYNLNELQSHLIPGTDSAYYLPEFIQDEEEHYLIRKITETSQQKWRNLPNRRLQIWGGELSAKSTLIPQDFPVFVNSFPDILQRIRDTGAFTLSPHAEPNNIILNEYLPGQGIMPHEDGPSYHPVVATLSLGSHAVFNYYQYRTDWSLEELPAPSSSVGRSINKKPILSVLLEPRSLVITTSSLYTSHLHGIEDLEEDVFPSPSSDDPPIMIANADLLAGERARDIVWQGGVLKREIRYSLTCRDVERVAMRLPFLKR